ncbi:MAG: 23S rRNA (adenine(2503)-C(2))-methyltransferase RlmN [Candidatus Omnitrophota bacterium]|jgi:23S rRNA (adenine2503-C2)-methyltransferase|nr:MAG: 23S rRNA (adenine(2503)-C(2))-methyltransferase RlmN [Candidatus Omnitrophota bacterium]
MKTNIKNVALEELGDRVVQWGYPRFHARQIFSWLYQKNALEFMDMSNIPSSLRSKLIDNYHCSETKVAEIFESSDGTKKLLLALYENERIEAALISAEKRITGCLSSQVGCRFSCAFCASGSKGFTRNLSSGQILDEVVYLKRCAPKRLLTHVVFMGMGEPFDNYENVLKAVRIINADYGFHIGARRITISTCGIPEGIRRLARENLQVELSVSLHAVDDATRSKLMPVNRKYPLNELFAAIGEYVKTTNRQVTFEYVVVDGINNGLNDATKLQTLLKGLNCKVNLIPYNPVEASRLKAPSLGNIKEFKGFLERRGITVTVRKSRGQDIDAACGQLRMRYEN